MPADSDQMQESPLRKLRRLATVEPFKKLLVVEVTIGAIACRSAEQFVDAVSRKSSIWFQSFQFSLQHRVLGFGIDVKPIALELTLGPVQKPRSQTIGLSEKLLDLLAGVRAPDRAASVALFLCVPSCLLGSDRVRSTPRNTHLQSLWVRLWTYPIRLVPSNGHQTIIRRFWAAAVQLSTELRGKDCFRSNFGNLAILAAIRPASSLVRSLAA